MFRAVTAATGTQSGWRALSVREPADSPGNPRSTRVREHHDKTIRSNIPLKSAPRAGIKMRRPKSDVNLLHLRGASKNSDELVVAEVAALKYQGRASGPYDIALPSRSS